MAIDPPTNGAGHLDVGQIQDETVQETTKPDSMEERQFKLDEQKVRAEIDKGKEEQAQGKIGSWLGGVQNAPVYIGLIVIGLTVLILVLTLAYLAIVDENIRHTSVELTKYVISTSLGLFGARKLNK